MYICCARFRGKLFSFGNRIFHKMQFDALIFHLFLVFFACFFFFFYIAANVFEWHWFVAAINDRQQIMLLRTASQIWKETQLAKVVAEVASGWRPRRSSLRTWTRLWPNKDSPVEPLPSEISSIAKPWLVWLDLLLICSLFLISQIFQVFMILLWINEIFISL